MEGRSFLSSSAKRLILVLQPNSPILLPALLDYLAPILFTLPSLDPAPLSIPLKSLLPTMWPAWFTDCLIYFRLLLTLDTSNRTGIKDRSILKKSAEEWIEPMERGINGLKREAWDEQVGFEAEFVLDRWEDALERVNQAILSTDSAL